MKNAFFKKALLTLVGAALSLGAIAQTLEVALAANLQPVIKEIQKDFSKKTGITIDPIVGSSGALAAQISNGAPFDVFLSADMSFPNKLFDAGFTDGKPVVYASGSLIICSNKNIELKNWKKTLLNNDIKKVAMGNPATAPYGKAAEQALQKEGILADVKPKCVYGENIAQVNIYITLGTADVGFTTQSLANDPENHTQLYWQLIPRKDYEPIEQGMVILKRTKDHQSAQKFYQYLLSTTAKRIFKRYGYYVN